MSQLSEVLTPLLSQQTQEGARSALSAAPNIRSECQIDAKTAWRIGLSEIEIQDLLQLNPHVFAIYFRPKLDKVKVCSKNSSATRSGILVWSRDWKLVDFPLLSETLPIH